MASSRYAPIARDVSDGLHRLYIVLAFGLIGLYALLLAISGLATRGLRRESRRNALLAGHDILTGLPNRSLFQRRATAALGARRRTAARFDALEQAHEDVGRIVGVANDQPELVATEARDGIAGPDTRREPAGGLAQQLIASGPGLRLNG